MRASDQLADEIYGLHCDIGRLEAENAKLRKLAARTWNLFLKHGAVHPCDLPEVDAVRNKMHELGVKADE